MMSPEVSRWRVVGRYVVHVVGWFAVIGAAFVVGLVALVGVGFAARLVCAAVAWGWRCL